MKKIYSIFVLLAGLITLTQNSFAQNNYKFTWDKGAIPFVFVNPMKYAFGYNIYRASDSNLTNAVQLNTGLIKNNTFLVPATKLPNGKNYIFNRAVNVFGIESLNSNVVIVSK